jgi:hypothetical protein
VDSTGRRARIDMVGLFAFLQDNGIIADSDQILEALDGPRGLGEIRNPDQCAVLALTAPSWRSR